MSATTDLDLLQDNSVMEESLDESNLSKNIVDCSLSLETRIKAINAYYKTEGRDNTIETINKIAMMYELSGIRSLKQYLFAICEKSEIEPFLKSIAAKALWSHNDKDPLSYKALDMVYPGLDENVGTPYRIELVKMLMNNEEEDAKVKTKNYFCDIIKSPNLDCRYRYKTIQSLESNPKCDYYMREACLTFVQDEKNELRYRILAGQYLLQKFTNTLFPVETRITEEELLKIAQNEQNEYNCRADATDVLLKLASDQTKKIAQGIIMNLGLGTKKISTIYDNAQNVHTQEVDESVQNTIEYLQNFTVMKVNSVPITFEYVQREILNSVSELSDDVQNAIKVALNRIEIDRALYSKYSCSLSLILLKIWTFIQGHKSKDEMLMRLKEELVEMAGTCSSGYVSRLINTISGFGDFGIRISWRDQITANLNGRLNARIKEMDDLRLQEKVLNEMTLDTGNFGERKHFLKFLLSCLSEIREELYEEFKGHISDTDFDLYFRSAVSMYESGTDV